MNSLFDLDFGGRGRASGDRFQRGSQNVRGRGGRPPWRGGTDAPHYAMRGARGGRRFDNGNYRGRGPSRNENTVRQPFIKVSSDGESLIYSQLGTENCGDPLIVDELVSSVKVIGEYSEDSERNFVNDRSYLPFLLTKYLPDSDSLQKVVNLDLKVGETEVQEYTSTGGKDLSNFLTWIINNRDVFKTEISAVDSSKGGGKFVTMKSIISNILSSPYRFGNEIKLYATSVNGVTYLMKEYRMLPSDRVGLWAHKFEQYMTREDTTKEVFCNEDFRAVLTCSLGPHRVLYSASLDCANPEEFEDDFTDLSAFVLLKCLPESELYNYRFQMMYWYNNYLVSGVPKTLLGQRNEDGVVTLLRMFEAPEMLQIGKEYWNPVNCIVFGSKLLSFIKDRVESDPGAVFCIRKESRQAEFSCVKTPEMDSFLPEWFFQDILETDEEEGDFEK